MTQIDYPNQSRRSLSYDALGRVSALHIEHIARTGRYRGQWETLETYQYHYDASGNLTDSSRNGQAARFAYDSLNRLIRADYPKGDDIDYQWDDRGNLVHKATKTHRFNYQYNAANQLVRFEAHRLPGFSCDGTACPTDDDDTGSPHWYDYAYNANGQPTELHNAQKGTQQLTHDALGRMTAVINPNGESVHYGYDSRDRRVRTDQVWKQDEDDNSTNSTTVSLISAFDGREELGQWLTENTVNTNSQATPYRSLTGLPQEEQGLPYNLMLHQQLFEPNRPELHAAGNKGADTRHLYLYGDHQNSTVQVRDQDSREAMRLGYSPFGQTYRKHNDKTFWKLNSGVNANNQLNALMPYQYTGRYTEAATGLVHLDARWYNPHTQRFVQPDLWNFRNTGLPSEIQHELMRFTGLDTAQLLRDPSQQVAYGYVSGNPLAWTDWLGLCEEPTEELNIFHIIWEEFPKWWGSDETSDLRTGIDLSKEAASIPYKFVSVITNTESVLLIGEAIKEESYDEAFIEFSGLVAGESTVKLLSDFGFTSPTENAISAGVSNLNDAILSQDNFSSEED